MARPYLTIDQVSEKLFSGPNPLRLTRLPLKRSGRNKSVKAIQQKSIVARRKEIRAAFDVVRYDPNEKLVARTLAGALGGSVEITDTLMQTVHQINSERAIRGVQSPPQQSENR